MPLVRTLAKAATLALMLAPAAARAETVVANCTGMLDFDIYRIDTSEPTQTVENIGLSEVSATEDAIVLTGDFGEYRFDLKVGTLYHNGSDTGIYCTYSTTDE